MQFIGVGVMYTPHYLSTPSACVASDVELVGILRDHSSCAMFCNWTSGIACCLCFAWKMDVEISICVYRILFQCIRMQISKTWCLF